MNASLFAAGGGDTTEIVLAGTTFYLLQNPAVMKKLTDEVCGAFKSEAELNSQNVSKLPYLVACLDETLRMCPTLNLMGCSAFVVPSGGDIIGNLWVLGGVGYILFLCISVPARSLIIIKSCRRLTKFSRLEFLPTCTQSADRNKTL